MDPLAAIGHAIAFMREQKGEVQICRDLSAVGVDASTAARLVEFLPLVYFRVLMANSGVRFSGAYRRVRPDGTKSPPILFSSEPLWNQVMEFAEAEVRRGAHRQQLLVIAGRSAECEAVNKLLNQGSKLADVGLTEPLLPWPESGPEL
jgi:hypothetical protein